MNDLNDYEAETIQEAWLGWAFSAGIVEWEWFHETNTVH